MRGRFHLIPLRGAEAVAEQDRDRIRPTLMVIMRDREPSRRTDRPSPAKHIVANKFNPSAEQTGVETCLKRGGSFRRIGATARVQRPTKNDAMPFAPDRSSLAQCTRSAS